MDRTFALRSLLVLGGCAAGAAAGRAVYGAYARDLDHAQNRLRGRSQVLGDSGVPIEYAAMGAGAPVLVSHGAGGGFDQGMEFADGLLGAGMRLIAVSRFGYLRSGMPADASPPAQADAYVRVLDALAIDRTAIIGASAGAPSALQFALRYPQRCSALILLVPAAYAEPEQGRAVRTPPGVPLLAATALRSDFLYWAVRRLAPTLMVRSILATPLQAVREASIEEQDRVSRTLDSILPVSRRSRGLRNDAAITSALPRYELEQIRVPTLLISMADDRYGTLEGARYIARHIPGAKLVSYARGGHLWIGHQEDVIREICDFLSGQRAGGRPDFSALQANPMH